MQNFEHTEHKSKEIHKKKKRKSRSRSSSLIRSRENSKSHRSRGIYHHYTIEYKLFILNKALTKSQSYIEREHGIDRLLLKKWKNDKSLLEAASNKKTSIKIIKNGGIPSTQEYDGFIAKYVKELRANCLPVNTTDIIMKAKEN